MLFHGILPFVSNSDFDKLSVLILYQLIGWLRALITAERIRMLTVSIETANPPRSA
jgi:hypothetical protein